VNSTIVLYGREGCCLCDDARTMLLRARERFAFELIERDIEADDELLRKFLERIPVIEIDGVERFELIIDESELLAALTRLQSSAPYQ
jgi:glutaredoxin